MNNVVPKARCAARSMAESWACCARVRSRSPRELVATIEALVEEGRWPRRTASLVEEKLLGWVDERGRWQGTRDGAVPQEPPGSELASVMERYWRQREIGTTTCSADLTDGRRAVQTGSHRLWPTNPA
jgi:hypothetical protein